MIGLSVAALGWLLIAAGLVSVLGAWVLIPFGAVTTVAGLFVDWEALRAEHR